MKIPRVTLELVRQGPPHNQLLSPLTPYFAICGNHEPEIVHVPFEHATLLRKLRSLRYEGPGGSPAQEVSADAEDVRRAIVDMLNSIRGLQSELTATSHGSARLIVLELVISAAELSLLPFELVFRPGMPTRELTATEVVVLRRTRRVPATTMRWPIRPHLLFGYASAGGNIPFERHLLALRECLDPLLVHTAFDTEEEAVRELRKYVTVVDEVTLPRLQREFEKAAREDREITHVHLLSHGICQDGKFGLVLRHPADPDRTDFVTGDRLASALTATTSDGDRILPACVTLAACDAGNAGDVTYVGSAVAHELHEGGIPLVIASQLPLSFRGSAAMVRELYEHLLGADDPQIALAEMRSAVRTWSSAGRGQLDWASLVAYGALPENLDSHVARGRVEVAKRSIESAIGLLDPLVGRPGHTRKVLDAKEREAAAHHAETAFRAAVRKLEGSAAPLELAWYLGAAVKRWADTWRGWDDALHEKNTASASPGGTAREAIFSRDWRVLMRRAAEHYLEAFALGGAPSALVQSLACRLFAGELPAGPAADATRPDAPMSPERQWDAALGLIKLRALHRAESDADTSRALMELWLMVPLIFAAPGDRERADKNVREARDSAPEKLIDAQIAAHEPSAFELYSLRRQALRFTELATSRRDEKDRTAEITKRAALVTSALERVGAPSRWTAVMDYRRTPGGMVPVESE